MSSESVKIYSSICPSFLCGRFPSGFQAKLLYAFHISPMCATCPIHIVQDFITLLYLLKCIQWLKLLILCFLYLEVTSYPLGSNSLLNTLLLNPFPGDVSWTPADLLTLCGKTGNLRQTNMWSIITFFRGDISDIEFETPKQRSIFERGSGEYSFLNCTHFSSPKFKNFIVKSLYNLGKHRINTYRQDTYNWKILKLCGWNTAESHHAWQTGVSGTSHHQLFSVSIFGKMRGFITTLATISTHILML